MHKIYQALASSSGPSTGQNNYGANDAVVFVHAVKVMLLPGNRLRSEVRTSAGRSIAEVLDLRDLSVAVIWCDPRIVIRSNSYSSPSGMGLILARFNPREGAAISR